jgi:hypothetical protein
VPGSNMWLVADTPRSQAWPADEPARVADSSHRYFLNAINHLREYACKVVEMTPFSCVDDYCPTVLPGTFSEARLETWLPAEALLHGAQAHSELPKAIVPLEALLESNRGQEFFAQRSPGSITASGSAVWTFRKTSEDFSCGPVSADR